MWRFLLSCPREPTVRIRAGIIGLDTLHVEHFTNLMNNPKNLEQAKDSAERER